MIKDLFSSIFSFCIAFLLCVACEEPVSLDIESVAPKIVVNGTFTPNHPFQITLSKNEALLSNDSTEFINNAKVQILDAQGGLLRELNYQENTAIPSYGFPGFQPQAQKIYQLAIEIPGYPMIYATSSAPNSVPIQSIKTEEITSAPNTSLYSIKINASILDPQGEQNYYHLQLYYQQIASRSSSNGLVGKPESFIPIPIRSANSENSTVIADVNKNGVLFSDDALDGEQINLQFQAVLDREYTGENPQIVGELRTISKDYYQYYTSLTRQLENKDRPFAEPVIVFNNIENGLGIFAGFNHRRDSVLINR